MLPDDAPDKVRDWYNENCVRPRRSREGAGFWSFSCTLAGPRGFGRTIYPPEVFQFLDERFADRRTGEVDLLKTFPLVS
jgi:hypothetical protein